MDLQNTIILYTGQLAIVNNKKTTIVKTTIVPKIIAKQGIYPKQRKQMLEKYRQYVQQYSNNCFLLNQEVVKYNGKVLSFIHQHDLTDLSETQTKKFDRQIGKVSIQEYNEAAKITNLQNGKPLIQLKKYIPIRKAIEHTFAMILFKYSMQIQEKNNILEGCGATTTRAIQKVLINHYELANTVINDVQTLPYHKRTVHNHIKRLVDAGVLFGYTFKGHKKPVEYYVNNEILTLFDSKTSKTLNAQNQLFKYENLKNLHDNDIVTRTIINKSNINENVNNHSRLKDSAPPSELPSKMQSSSDDNQSNYQNTNSPKVKKETMAPEKLNPVSGLLLKSLLPQYQLIESLAFGDYKNHRFKFRKHFEAEMLYGNLTKSEFLELLQQEFMKIVAPIYKSMTVFEGSWHNSYEDITNLFLNNNGTVPGKVNLLNTFNSLVWRITFAKQFYRKFKDYKPLFPSQYFDPTRQLKKSGGFAYTLNQWKKQQEYEANKYNQIQKRNVEAAKRNKNYRAIELVENKIRSMINGKLNIVELHNWICDNQNIPVPIKNRLPHYLERAYNLKQ